MSRTDLPDRQWRELAPHLPSAAHRGPAYVEHRAGPAGILWRLKTGAPWRDVLARYGRWQRIPKSLQEKADVAEGIDWDGASRTRPTSKRIAVLHTGSHETANAEKWGRKKRVAVPFAGRTHPASSTCAVESVTVTLLNLARPSMWDVVSDWIGRNGPIANSKLREISGLDTLVASKQLRNWVAQGVLVALPSASRQQARYTKPGLLETVVDPLSFGPDNEIENTGKLF